MQTSVNWFQVEYKVVDLASFCDIKSFVDQYKSTHANLHILINNAGVFSPSPVQTEQEIEATTGINYLGHFYLTYLLTDILIPVKGRVIVVSSEAYKGKKITFKMLDGEKPVIFQPVAEPGWVQYSLSNLCRVLFAKELIIRYPDLISVSLHPGAIKTDIGRNLACCFKCIGSCLGPCLKSPDEGAQTTTFCATADIEDFNGMYFKNCKQEPIKEGLVSTELQKKLWEISLTVVKTFEKSYE